MKELLKILKTDIMKLKSSKLFWVHLFIPLLGNLLFLSYYRASKWGDFEKLSAYIQVLGIVFPIMISIVCSILAQQEYDAGYYQNLFKFGSKIYLNYLSKLILLIALGFMASLIALLVYYFGYNLIGDSVLNIKQYIIIAVILILSNFSEYNIHLFLSLRFSKNISIGIAAIETLISALFMTGLGEGRWYFLPAAWGPRYAIYYLNGIKNYDLKLALIISIIFTVLIFLSVIIWFNKWEGNRLEE
ncbi:MAG: lantibiotic immunity ABC transporter MutG family permease subunit [Tissierellia bacterium]|nr:lantibiotic immunity ABC transporter MutG family permease subunit [Tissierellia bacterium]